MKYITINEASQLINQLIEGYERNSNKIPVEGSIIFNKDNGYFPTALKVRIEPNKGDNENVAFSFLYLVLTGTEMPGYQHAIQCTTIEELKVLCSNIEELEIWITNPISIDNQVVPFGFNEEQLAVNQEIERQSDEEIANYLNEYFEIVQISEVDIADFHLAPKEMEEFVNDIKTIGKYRPADDVEVETENVNEHKNKTITPQQIPSKESDGGLGSLIVAAGFAGIVFSAGVAVGITLPFIGAAKLCRKLFR